MAKADQPEEVQPSSDVTVDGTATTDVPDDADKLFKISVPADTGDSVTLTGGGREERTFTVTDGVISPRSKADAVELLGAVPGAKRVD